MEFYIAVGIGVLIAAGLIMQLVARSLPDDSKIETSVNLVGHNGPVNDASFSPDACAARRASS